MARSRRRKLRSTRAVGGRASLANKKNVAAAVLLTIMGIMWVRVLRGDKPNASAAKTPVVEETEEQKESVDIRFIDLPVVPGRNDTIDRDFFAVQDWSNFTPVSGASSPATNSEVQAVSSDRNEEVLARMAQKLKLEAVSPPNAMINDQILQVGGQIEVREGADVYSFDVLQIDEDSVVVRRSGHDSKLTLKLAQSNDVSN